MKFARKILAGCVLFLAVFSACHAQTRINPVTQINWPLIAGSGTPTSLSMACSTVNYGQPYQNLAVTPNTYYTCGSDGWAVRGGSGGGGPNNFPGTAHQFITSYNSGTQNLAGAQPVEADVVNLVSDLAL